MVVDRDEVFVGKDSVDLRLNRGDRGDEGPEGLPPGRDLGIVLDEVLGYQLVDNSEVADAHGGKQPLDDIAVGGGVGHDMVPFSKLVTLRDQFRHPGGGGPAPARRHFEVTVFAPPYNVLDPSCPSRFILTRIGERWTALIVSLLGERCYRFGELRRTAEGISQKMLTQTLRAPEKDGLVRREVISTRPVSVEYSLTDLGRTLVPVVGAVVRWAEEHAAEVLEAHGRQA